MQIQGGGPDQRKCALDCWGVGFCDNYMRLQKYVFNQTRTPPEEMPIIDFKAANGLNISFGRQCQVDF